jgi:hypothetical protein
MMDVDRLAVGGKEAGDFTCVVIACDRLLRLSDRPILSR